MVKEEQNTIKGESRRPVGENAVYSIVFHEKAGRGHGGRGI